MILILMALGALAAAWAWEAIHPVAGIIVGFLFIGGAGWEMLFGVLLHAIAAPFYLVSRLFSSIRDTGNEKTQTFHARLPDTGLAIHLKLHRRPGQKHSWSWIYDPPVHELDAHLEWTTQQLITHFEKRKGLPLTWPDLTDAAPSAPSS